MDAEYKCLLISNKSNDAQITLYTYCSWDPLCWLSYSSKIIPSGQKYLHRPKRKYKFELIALHNSRKTKLTDILEWEVDQFIAVDDSLNVTKSDLENHQYEKRVCLRRSNMDQQIQAEGGRNLYEILELDYEQVRKESQNSQDKMIKKAFHKAIRRWHPDHNQTDGDDHIASEVLFAYSVLKDPAQRANYNKTADYDRGWLSLSRWRSIFWPDCYNKEQKWAYRKRMALMVLSLGLFVGGIASTVCTAGLASPALVALGGIAGGGLLGAGMNGGLRTIKRDSIENGCKWSTYAKSVGIGFVGGAVAGGAAVGITAGIAGIGSAAAETLTMGQYIGIGAASGAAGGVSYSLSSNAERKFIDKEDVSARQVLTDAVAGAVVGCGAGAVGGVVTKAFAGKSVGPATTNIESEAGGALVARAGAKRFAMLLAKNVSCGMADKGTGSVGNTVAHFITERLDDSAENRPPEQHLLEGLKDVAVTIVKEGAVRSASSVASHTISEIKARKNAQRLQDDQPVKYKDLSYSQKKELRRRVRTSRDAKTRVQFTDCKGNSTYSSLDKASLDIHVIEELSEEELDYEIIPQLKTGRVRYISEGHWKSKMIVNYKYNNTTVKEQLCGNGKSLEIPTEATDIEVQFEVLRFLSTWCHVKKWNRFQKRWEEGLHVFHYKEPPKRTFTIGGPLYWERVIAVTDECFDDVSDM